MKFTTKGSRHIENSSAYLRNGEKLRGSAGSAEGWGTKRSSSCIWFDVVHSRCSATTLNRNYRHNSNYVPISVTVPGGVAFLTSAFERLNACLKPAIMMRTSSECGVTVQRTIDISLRDNPSER